MVKKNLLTFISVTLLVLMLNAPAYALNLRFNVMFTPKHPLCKKVFVPWAEQVKEVTNGRVKVTMFYASALFKPKGSLDAISSRIGDIGIVLPVYTRNRLLMNSVMDLPLVAGESALINSEVFWELFQSEPDMQKELRDVKVLWAYMNNAFQLHFTKKKVENLDDLKNVVISAGGQNQVQITRILGASPETMPMNNVFLAMQKGVIEGCFLNYAPLRPQKIANLLNYHTNANLMAVAFFIAVNPKAWEKISQEDQKAIEAISGMSAAQKCGKVFDNAQKRDIEWMAQKGDKFYTLSTKQQKMWADKLKPVREKWINDAKAKGYVDPERLFDKALRLMEEKSK